MYEFIVKYFDPDYMSTSATEHGIIRAKSIIDAAHKIGIIYGKETIYDIHIGDGQEDDIYVFEDVHKNRGSLFDIEVKE